MRKSGKSKKMLAFALAMMLGLSWVPVQQVQVEAKAAQKPCLNYSNVTMLVQDKAALCMRHTNAGVKWSSSDKNVAVVSKKGMVKAKKTGKVVITAKVKNKKYTCKVTIKKKAVLNQKTLKLAIDDTYKLKLKGTTGKAGWASSNKAVATVSKTGKVTALQAGTADITAKLYGKTYTCRLCVVGERNAQPTSTENKNTPATTQKNTTTQKNATTQGHPATTTQKVPGWPGFPWWPTTTQAPVTTTQTPATTTTQATAATTTQATATTTTQTSATTTTQASATTTTQASATTTTQASAATTTQASVATTTQASATTTTQAPVTTEAKYTISGVAKDSDKNVYTGQVAVYRQQIKLEETNCQPDGSFTFENQYANGTYAIYAQGHKVTDVTVADADITAETLALDVGYKVSVTAFMQEGLTKTALTKTDLFLTSSQELNVEAIKAAGIIKVTTDENGQFQTYLPAGQYWIGAGSITATSGTVLGYGKLEISKAETKDVTLMKVNITLPFENNR